MIRPIAALVIAAMSAAVLAQAPTAPTRIRATLEQVDGNLLTVKTRTGEVMKVKVPDNVVIIGIAKASMRPGDERGVAEQAHALHCDARRFDVEDGLEEGLRVLEELG